MPSRIQVRRDSAARWAAANPILLSGEIGFELDTSKVKIGDGLTAWNVLSYALDTAAITIDRAKLAGIEAGAQVNPRDLDAVPDSVTRVAFTPVERDKLSGIAAGAEANLVTSVYGRTGAVTAADGDYTAEQVADTPSKVIMTGAERSKLAGIEAGAQLNAVTSVHGRTGAIVAQAGDYTADQVGDGTTKVVMTVAERTKLTGIETGAQVNPTDLDDVPDGSDRLALTAAERSKLAGIETGAQVNPSNLDGVSDSATRLAMTPAERLRLSTITSGAKGDPGAAGTGQILTPADSRFAGGAVGDGVADDYAALQAFLDAACGVGPLASLRRQFTLQFASATVYATSRGLQLKQDCHIAGNGAIIRAIGSSWPADHAVLAPDEYYQTEESVRTNAPNRAWAAGVTTRLEYITIDANNRAPYGLIMMGFNSRVSYVRVWNALKDAVLLTEMNIEGLIGRGDLYNSTTGRWETTDLTCVNNQFDHCQFHQSGQAGFRLAGHDDYPNAKVLVANGGAETKRQASMTDGMITDSYIYGKNDGSSTWPPLVMRQLGGWQIRGNHFYYEPASGPYKNVSMLVSATSRESSLFYNDYEGRIQYNGGTLGGVFGFGVQRSGIDFTLDYSETVVVSDGDRFVYDNTYGVDPFVTIGGAGGDNAVAILRGYTSSAPIAYFAMNRPTGPKVYLRDGHHRTIDGGIRTPAAQDFKFDIAGNITSAGLSTMVWPTTAVNADCTVPKNFGDYYLEFESLGGGMSLRMERSTYTVASVSVAAGGSGYAVGQVLTHVPTGQTATVASVGTSGSVATVTMGSAAVAGRRWFGALDTAVNTVGGTGAKLRLTWNSLVWVSSGTFTVAADGLVTPSLTGTRFLAKGTQYRPVVTSVTSGTYTGLHLGFSVL